MKKLAIIAALLLGSGPAFAVPPMQWTDQNGVPQGTNAAPVATQSVGVTGATTAVTTSGSINTFTALAPANPSRLACMYQNTGTGTQYVFIGTGTPTIAASFKLAPGASFDCSHPSGVTERGLLSVASTVASDTGTLLLQ